MNYNLEVARLTAVLTCKDMNGGFTEIEYPLGHAKKVLAASGIPQPQPTAPAGLREAAAELFEVAQLRGDNELPLPEDDPKDWTARMQTAWDDLEAALAPSGAVEPSYCASCGGSGGSPENDIPCRDCSATGVKPTPAGGGLVEAVEPIAKAIRRSWEIAKAQGQDTILCGWATARNWAATLESVVTQASLPALATQEVVDKATEALRRYRATPGTDHPAHIDTFNMEELDDALTKLEKLS